MNAAPYHNEPGCETERTPGAVESYNDCITHETIRVAVVGVLNSFDFDRNHFKVRSLCGLSLVKTYDFIDCQFRKQSKKSF